MGIWLKRFWKTGARFDTVQWAEKVSLTPFALVGYSQTTDRFASRQASFWTHGSLTFREAYERTGRVLNVSVIPHDRHSPTKLLNVRCFSSVVETEQLCNRALTDETGRRDSTLLRPTASSGRPSSPRPPSLASSIRSCS
jgi:hypothetical protein